MKKRDVDLTDERGRVLVRLSGLAARAMAPVRDVSECAMGDTLFLAPRWEPAMPGGSVREVGASVRFAFGFDSSDTFGQAARRLLAGLRQAMEEGRGAARTLVQVAVPDAGPKADFGALGAMLRCAVQEDSRLCCQLLRVSDLSGDLGDIFDEAAGLGAEHSCTDLRRGPQGWSVRRFEQVREQAAGAGVSLWRDGGCYLVSGGLGGLGALLAKHILKRAPGAQVFLTGRTAREAMRPGQRERLAELTSDERIAYLACDVAEEGAVKRLIERVNREAGGLLGVAHAAGVLADGLIRTKTEADIARVLAPKVGGALALDRATADLPIEHFLLFGSGAAALGNAGQADYATANAWLEEFAAERNRKTRTGERSGRTLCVHWPLWAEGGMQVPPALLKRLREQTGTVPMSAEAGLAALETAWDATGETGDDSLLVLHGGREKLLNVVRGSVGLAGEGAETTGDDFYLSLAERMAAGELGAEEALALLEGC